MSGSGGFYKYRCKYFYTHNCPNWVWVNNASCASCLAEGRDAGEELPMVGNSAWKMAKEICVPLIRDGALEYTLMEIVASDESGNDWTLRQKTPQPTAYVPLTTRDTPDAVLSTAGVPRSMGH